MTREQKARLIKSLQIRSAQLCAKAEGKQLKYELHDGHHHRDVATVISLLTNSLNADRMLKNMPIEEDLPTEV